MTLRSNLATFNNQHQEKKNSWCGLFGVSKTWKCFEDAFVKMCWLRRVSDTLYTVKSHDFCFLP